MKWKSIVCGAILSVALAAPTEATPSGTFTITDIASGVTVGLTYIDWEPADVPPGTGDGTFEIGGGTDLTYTASGGGDGMLSAGETGVVLDLNAATVFPVPDFFTFDQDPDLTYSLDGFEAGSANTNCSALAVGQSCSPFVGSPFILTLIGGGQTIVSLAAFGTATDTTGSASWSGSWSTQISDMTPLEIQQFFGCQTGDTVDQCDSFGVDDRGIFSTYSGEFTATIVPEPTMLALFGIGLVGAGARLRRRRG